MINSEPESPTSPFALIADTTPAYSPPAYEAVVAGPQAVRDAEETIRFASPGASHAQSARHYDVPLETFKNSALNLEQDGSELSFSDMEFEEPNTSGGAHEDQVALTGADAQIARDEIPRTLSLWSGVAMIVGLMIGGGIFASPGPILVDTGKGDSRSGIARNNSTPTF
jgi:hypothetical protein